MSKTVPSRLFYTLSKRKKSPPHARFAQHETILLHVIGRAKRTFAIALPAYIRSYVYICILYTLLIRARI